MERYIIIGVMVFLIVSLYAKWLKQEITFFVSVVALMVCNIITPQELIGGLSNEYVLVIVLLFSLGELLRKLHFLEYMLDRLFRNTNRYKPFLGKIMLLVGSMSVFLNNTPLVAILMPYAHSWSMKNGVSSSKLLIPLSFAAILGGCCTLIGSSTNLMVNSLLSDYSSDDIELLGLFDFTIVGGVMLVLGFLYILFIGYKFLPNNKNTTEEIQENSREFLVEAKITPKSTIIGKSIEDAGLRNLDSLYLVQVNRNGERVKAVEASFILQVADELVFAGDTHMIMELVSSRGLELSQEDLLEENSRAELIELVVAPNSLIAGKTIKQIKFRSIYNGAVIAVHRNKEKLSGRIGDIVLKTGDVLLIIAGEDCKERIQNEDNFYIMSKLQDIRNFRSIEGVLLFGGTVLSVVLASLGIVSLLSGLLVLFAIALLFQIITPRELYKSINFKLGLVIVMALAIGKALAKTGLSSDLANVLLQYKDGLGVLGIYVILYVIGVMLSACVTNKAAVAILIPICVTIAQIGGLALTPLVLLVAFASAASFITPHGYQTNQMVFQLGKYSYRDYFKIGFPLTLLYMVVAITIIYYTYH